MKPNPSRFDLSSARFAFLDLETTGLSPWFGDRICEVGIILTEGRRIKQQFQALVNPERPLSPGAASTNGLTDEELSRQHVFADIADTVVEWLRGTVVVCHNAQFDIQFLDSEFRRLKREIQIPNLIDTLMLARQNYDLPSYSLQAIAEAFHVPVMLAHRALDDAHTARGIFFGMMDGLKEFNKPLDEYIGIYNSPVWPNDGIQLPTELGEAIYSKKKLFIRYVDGDNQQTERWVTPKQVMGLSDYVYLQAHCHLRNAERNFRLDRIIEVRVEIESKSV
ncbi:MAG TPA: exonuclease domain-containing protein [Anaerolineales bacterium]|nr:exonuclease domain-containing protein [Anaerolineales bacterium]